MQILHTSYTKREVERILDASQGRKLTISENSKLKGQSILDKNNIFFNIPSHLCPIAFNNIITNSIAM